MNRVEVDITDNASPALRRFLAGVSDRAALHRMVAPQVENLTREHVRGEAAVRHNTARALGAQPTGELEEAAERISSSADGQGVSVSIGSPLFARAFRDVTIRPIGRKALTIPIHALSYGQRVSSLQRQGMTIFRIPRTRILATRAEGSGELLPLYALASSITQRQDRTLLPSDDAYGTAARAGVRDFIDRQLLAQP